MGRPGRRHWASPLVQYEVAETLPYQQRLFVCAGEWLALGRGKTPFQRASHCALFAVGPSTTKELHPHTLLALILRQPVPRAARNASMERVASLAQAAYLAA